MLGEKAIFLMLSYDSFRIWKKKKTHYKSLTIIPPPPKWQYQEMQPYVISSAEPINRDSYTTDTNWLVNLY